MRSRSSLLLAVLFVASATAANAAPAKPAWEWSTDERLASRGAQRSPARRPAAAHGATHAAGADYFEIDGKQNPELFLPFELFRSLIGHLSDERDLAEARRLFDRAVDAAGWQPDEFWRDLRSIAGPYLAIQAERLEQMRIVSDLAGPDRRATETRIERLGVALCRTRAESLVAARAHFGMAFDRFLYTAVAPATTLTSAVPAPADIEHLRLLDRGCQ